MLAGLFIFILVMMCFALALFCVFLVPSFGLVMGLPALAALVLAGVIIHCWNATR